MATKLNTKGFKTLMSSKDSLPEIRIRSVFQPLFNPNKEIKKDNDGRHLKGTALLLFQGIVNSMNDWKDENGDKKEQAKLAFVFAVKSTDGTFKNIPVKTNYTYQPGNLLDLILKSLNITDFLKEVVDDEEDEDFGTITVLDEDKVKNAIEELRGLAYTADMEMFTSKRGQPLYQILVKTISPRLDKNNNHSRKQKKEETNPIAVTIDWED
jgi:hypothetical protein